MAWNDWARRWHGALQRAQIRYLYTTMTVIVPGAVATTDDVAALEQAINHARTIVWSHTPPPRPLIVADEAAFLLTVQTQAIQYTAPGAGTRYPLPTDRAYVVALSRELRRITRSGTWKRDPR